MKKLLILLVVCMANYGCVPLLVGTTVYGVQKGKQNRTERLREYDRYRLKLEEINLEREKQGLEKVKIESFQDWNYNVDDIRK